MGSESVQQLSKKLKKPFNIIKYIPHVRDYDWQHRVIMILLIKLIIT